MGTSHTITAIVDCGGQPIGGVNVSLSVTSGPNTGVGFEGSTDDSGQVSFTYDSNGQPGTDTIEASFTTGETGGGPCSTATKTWEEVSEPVDNRMPEYNLLIDPHQKPPCGCSDGSRTSFTATECPKCTSIGQFAGVAQDTGGRTVYLHNGEFFHHVVDLEIPGRGFNWKFARSYRSGITFNGPLGHNWEFNYNRRLFVMAGGDVVRMDGFARADAYTLNGDGSYTAPTGFYTGLVQNPDGTFIEREPNGTKIHYSRPDRQGVAVMTQVVDRNSNRMQFNYSIRGQLVQVIDTLGRPIMYRYNADRRLIEVRDFSGRSIRFEYDRNADLVAVTSPAVRRTPNRNDFRRGKTTRYTYSSGFRNDVLNHNLLTVTAPNEVASRGQPRTQIEYDTNPRSANLDRVRRQTIGGVNAPAEFRNGQIRFRRDGRVPAGGTIAYEYEFLGGVPEDDFNAPVTQTTITDRNGNRTQYQFNQLGNIVRIREFSNRNVRPGDPQFYETRYEYNRDGEMSRMIYPEGNAVEYLYDEGNQVRFQQGNLVAEIRRPDTDRGGDQAFIRTNYSYEPIYNQTRRVSEPRGNDPSYIPQNGGTNSPARYTTVYVFDYQEGENFAALAQELGVSENEVRDLLRRANIPMGLGDVNGDGRTDQIAGNIVKVVYPTVNLLPDSNMARIEGGTQQVIEEVSTYNDFGQRLRRIDPEGNVDIYDYHPENDPDGDGEDLTRGVGDGPFGYLKEVIRDTESHPTRNSRTNPEPAQIRRQSFYDRVGNLIKEIDGRGIATEYVVNQLNQVVQIIRAADGSEARRNPEEPNWAGCSDPELVECQAGMVAFRYVINLFYDYNNNLIRREVENRDSNNERLAGDFIEFTRAYDILDNEIEATREVSQRPPETLITRYRYDRNENRVLTMSPVAVAGEQPSNVVSFIYDERDLRFTSTRGGLTNQFRSLAAHADIPERNRIPSSPDISTFTRVYDRNRNLHQSIDGADNTGDGQPDLTTTLYDGFDRPVSVIDAVGNQSFTEYDPASNVIRVSKFGPVGGPSPRTNRAATFTQPLTVQSFHQPPLSQVQTKYDELNRAFERDYNLFDYRDQGVNYVRPPVLRDGPLGGSNDGRVVMRYEYDRKSRWTFSIEDDLDTFQRRYDGVDRVIESIDPEQNRVQYAYDDNNNLVKTIETEITQRDDVRTGKIPDLLETFTTINVYDSLDRRIRTTDNIGQTRRYHYDSRDNLILMSDAQHSDDLADLIPDPLGLFPAATQASSNKSGGRQLANSNHHRGTEITEKTLNDSVFSASPWWNPPHPRSSVFTSSSNHRGAEITEKTLNHSVFSTSPWQTTDDSFSSPSPPRFPIGSVFSAPSAVHSNASPEPETTTSPSLAFQSASGINRPGNTMEYFYDGINRKIADVRHLRVDGQGKNPIDRSNPANRDGLIVVDYDWDANNRLLARADDGSSARDQNTSVGEIESRNPEGNITRYVYDDLNRRKQEIFDDGTINDTTYDADDNLVRVIDENGSIIGNSYDGINRLVRRDIIRATSDAPHPAGGFKDPNVTWQVIGTTLQEFEYDGLSRLTRSFDNNDPDDLQDDAAVTLAYDSLNRLLEEVQNGQAVSSRWDGDNNRIGLVYPNGREIDFTYDKLDRIDRITNHESRITNPMADYDYIGPGRVLERTYSNGVRLTYLDDARRRDIGYDGLKRVVGHRHLRQNNSLVAGFAYDYDRANNKLFEIKSHESNRREDYGYDSLYRLTRFSRQGEPEDAWQLDGVGNWVSRQGVSNLANNLNEYTLFAGARQLHDDNGNLIDNGHLRYEYDVANRLRRVVRKSDNAVIAVYRYDIHNRRNERLVTNTASFNDQVRYLYDGWRVIAGRRVSSTQQYVYGRRIDERLTLDKDVNNDGAVDQSFFYHQDGKAYVAALTNVTASVVDQVTYDAYGRPSSEESPLGNPYLFTGRRHDPETRLYYFRARFYDPTRGRFLQRDPIGIWRDMVNLGNGYTYVGNDAINRTDPLGLAQNSGSKSKVKNYCDFSGGIYYETPSGKYGCWLPNGDALVCDSTGCDYISCGEDHPDAGPCNQGMPLPPPPRQSLQWEVLAPVPVPELSPLRPAMTGAFSLAAFSQPLGVQTAGGSRCGGSTAIPLIRALGVDMKCICSGGTVGACEAVISGPVATCRKKENVDCDGRCEWEVTLPFTDQRFAR